MNSLEANENVPGSPAPPPVNSFRAFLSEEIGTLTAILFVFVEFGIVVRFTLILRHTGRASVWGIEHFVIAMLIPVIMLIAVFVRYRRLKQTLELIDTDPAHLDTIMKVFHGMVLIAFFGMSMLLMMLLSEVA